MGVFFSKPHKTPEDFKEPFKVDSFLFINLKWDYIFSISENSTSTFVALPKKLTST